MKFSDLNALTRSLWMTPCAIGVIYKFFLSIGFNLFFYQYCSLYSTVVCTNMCSKVVPQNFCFRAYDNT